MAKDRNDRAEEIRLDLSHALIVDDDEVARNLIVNHLGKLGVTRIDQFESGSDAWDSIQKAKYELIVIDWKLPGLSGLALFNRIRALQTHRTTPLLVVSGFLEKNDFRLLQEFPCTGLMEKPFTKTLFQHRVNDLVKENVWYAENSALIDSLISAVDRDAKKAEQLLKQVLKQSPNPIPLALIMVRRLVTARMLKNAEGVLRDVLAMDDGCLIAIGELGKVLHLQGRHQAAMDVLRQASKLSPQNLQRLCLLGEVKLNMQDPEEARNYFQKALEIDAESYKAKAGIVVSDNLASMLKTPAPATATATFASILNTMGIAQVRNGQYAKGIEQYRAAMAFLYSRADSARVAFNLGLGFLRWGKPNEALPWFQKSENLSPSGFGKSAAYISKLLERGGLSSDVTEFATEDVAFDRAENVKKKPEASTAPTITDEEDDNVIPFPVGGADKPAPIEEIDEEHVGNDGTQVVLKDSTDRAIDSIASEIEAEDAENLDNLDGRGETLRV